MKTKNIMIVGVGGQGSLLASKLLGQLLLSQGYDVKVSEVHGMSQRGGSVVTYVRYGERVASPVIDRGEADFIVSFEVLEAARWLPYLAPGGQIVTSVQQIDPMPVVTGSMTYPEAKDLTPVAATYASSLTEFVKMSGTLKISGDYVNIEINGVDSDTRMGSVSQPLDALEASSFDGMQVVVTGYFTGLTGRKRKDFL